MTTPRAASISRQTSETTVTVSLALDGSGNAQIKTGIGMLDHLLDQIARHGLFDLTVAATGDDVHHVVEDVGIVLGQAFTEALGDRRGIGRMGHAVVPMDDALALVAVDCSGRGYIVLDAFFGQLAVGDLPRELVGHFLRSFATEGRLNLHARILCGSDDHHKAEAIFKALARALDMATALDPRRGGEVPSTKGLI